MNWLIRTLVSLLSLLAAPVSAQIVMPGGGGGISGGSVAQFLGYMSTGWYPALPLGVTASGGAGAPATTNAYCTYIQLLGPNSATISGLGISITTAGTSTVQLGLYNNNPALPPHPGTLIDNTSDISTTTATGISKALGTAHTLSPGSYWGCVEANDTTVRWAGVTVGTITTLYTGSTNIINAKNNSTSFATSAPSGGYGTWPSLVGATFNDGTSAAPAIFWGIQ